jgi:hypothetical protein
MSPASTSSFTIFASKIAEECLLLNPDLYIFSFKGRSSLNPLLQNPWNSHDRFNLVKKWKYREY